MPTDDRCSYIADTTLDTVDSTASEATRRDKQKERDRSLQFAAICRVFDGA